MSLFLELICINYISKIHQMVVWLIISPTILGALYTVYYKNDTNQIKHYDIDLMLFIKTFPNQSFSMDYWIHHPINYLPLLKALVSTSGQGKLARFSGLQKKLSRTAKERLCRFFLAYSASDLIELSIGIYPVQRQIFPSSAVLISSSVGLGLLSRRHLELISIPGVQ